MSDTAQQSASNSLFPNRTVYIVALIFVAMGVINSMPVIPGWEEMWQNLSGIEKLKTRKFSTEWFYSYRFLCDDADCGAEEFDVAGVAWHIACLVWRVYGYGPCCCGGCHFHNLPD